MSNNLTDLFAREEAARLARERQIREQLAADLLKITGFETSPDDWQLRTFMIRRREWDNTEGTEVVSAKLWVYPISADVWVNLDSVIGPLTTETLPDPSKKSKKKKKTTHHPTKRFNNNLTDFVAALKHFGVTP